MGNIVYKSLAWSTYDKNSIWTAFKDSSTSYLIMEKKKTKQEGVEVSREDRYVDRCGTGLLDGQRHARVDQKQTNHIAQPRAPCNMRQNYSLVC